MSGKLLIALGSNATSGGMAPPALIRAAMDALVDVGFAIRGRSRLFRTPAFPAGSGDDYVNAAVAMDSADPAEAVLTKLHEIEARFGRRRRERWASRTLDLDILAHGDRVAPDLKTYEDWRDAPLARQQTDAPDRLILPHPRLQDRAFVLVPLADVAPDWRHPVSGLSVAEMLDALPPGDVAAIVPL